MEPVGKRNRLDGDNIKKLLGNRIRQLRKEHGLTQEDLAETLNTQASYVGAIESGQKFPRPDTLARIAQALEVSLIQLWMFEGDVPAKNRYIRELIDYLRTGKEGEAKFLLAVAREYRKGRH